ncbi:MAG: NADH-quinone oxidoreductase subunit J [Myxococcales bacterium]|nr:NADH-quinone oxidoreductase subunit J [Myxococcales bacterium]
MIAALGFGIIASVLMLAAIRVVSSPDLVRSVLWLALVLVMTAVLFLTLSAPFLAGIQLLLYTGGVITLMLFGVMLTSRQAGVEIRNEIGAISPAVLFSTILFGIMGGAIYRSSDALPRPAFASAPAPDTEALGRAFLTEHMLSFELLSVLLLAAMIGAIVLARRRDFGAPEPAPPSERTARADEETRS